MTCWHCFREIDTEGPCPFCGYDPRGQREKYPLSLCPGSILNGRYTVGRVLGQGGFGVTYIAQDFQTGRRVAIKEYLPMELAARGADGNTLQVFSADREESFAFGKEQFLAEARTLAAFIGDEHIVRIHSYFEENGTGYFVMDYIDGPSLDEYRKQRGGRLTPDEAGRLLLPLMESLGRVHARGMVHRDIAPDNILIENGQSAKLIDFGAARYSTGEKSRSLDMVLKHGFVPYEQYMRRGRQGPWTDVYALAATFYFAVTGQVPPEAVERRNEDQLIPLSRLGVQAGPAVERVLGKALAVQAQDRYQSMAEFHRELQAALRDPQRAAAPEPMPPGKPEAPSGSERGGKKGKPVVLAAAAAVLVLAVIGFLALRGGARPVKTALPAVPAAAETPLPVPTPSPEPLSDTEEEQVEEPAALSAEPAVKALEQAAAGDLVRIGRYEQDGDTADGREEIEWLVLEKDGSRLLAVSCCALDCQPFHTGKGNDWESAALRAWLHDAFYDRAFSKEEQAMLPQGAFLLSAETAAEVGAALPCRVTDYALARGCNADADGACWWWLSSPGAEGNAACVGASGAVDLQGRAVGDGSGGIRPAVWIDLGAEEPGGAQSSGPVPEEALAQAVVGGTLLFGSYEQDGDESNGKEPIEWLVLDKKDGRFLVISSCALDRQPFHTRSARMTWSECSLRTWLNRTFLNEAFTPEEQAMIPTVTVTADKNPAYDTNPGAGASDQVFLLSILEAHKYFVSDDARRCEATRSAFSNDSYSQGRWWLRSPGTNSFNAAAVTDEGYVDSYCGVSSNCLVRPAMWIRLPD